MKPITPEEKVFTVLDTSETLRTIVAYEPEVNSILLIAARFEKAADRWFAYEALKLLFKEFVGTHARLEELRTSHHYKTMLDAIDQLLVQPEEEKDFVEEMAP